MKIDLDKDRFESFLEPWQVPLFIKVLSTDEPIRTSAAHSFLSRQDNSIYHVSRASVIFFLQDLEEEGILESEEVIGKGGRRQEFRRVRDLNETLTMLNEKVNLLFRGLQGKVNSE